MPLSLLSYFRLLQDFYLVKEILVLCNPPEVFIYFFNFLSHLSRLF